MASFENDMLPFFHEMTRKFRKHIPDRGDSWKERDWDILTALLHEIVEGLTIGSSPDEWADVANYAFFMWYRMRING